MKLVKLLTLLMIVFSFSGCKKESSNPAVADLGEDFIEITLNGNTVKNSSIVSFSYGMESNNGKYRKATFYQSFTASYSLDVSLAYFEYNTDFSGTPGEYRLNGKDSYIKPNEFTPSYDLRNLDLVIDLRDKEYSSVNPFKFQDGSKHTVTSVVKKGTDKSGNNVYSVSGTFSCKFINEKTNLPYNFTGKYRYTFSVLT